MDSVAVFTDTYLPTVNGVTYTIQTWRDRWQDRGGRMDVVYPGSDGHDPSTGEYPVRSLPFPFYDGFRLALPQVPDPVHDADVVHAHTPFALGLAGLHLAWRHDKPFVASYHTPTSEYATYLTSRDSLAGGIERVSERYERWFYGRADLVVVPSRHTRDHLADDVGVDSRIEVVPNGIDVGRFRPTDPAAFRRRYDLHDGPLIGYTGRHGYEKRLGDLLDAAADVDAADGEPTVVFGGDGPARDDLEARAEGMDLDVRFLGFLDREELPAFYSALDVFAFPSPVETQGLVALEANACGTPVVGVDSGALAITVDDGETGYHYAPGDIDGFREGLERALEKRSRLGENCLARREALSVDHAIDRLSEVYGSLTTA
jgi:glycosyltransferase involved in cell wall biosynthesis